ISHVTNSADPNYNNKTFGVEVKVTDNDDPMPFVPGTITMVVVPDTQYYVTNDTGNEIYKYMMQWVKDNASQRNIQAVLHVGDVTDNNSDVQWGRAKTSMSILDGYVPYALAVGNHDGYTATKLNNYFHISDNSKNQAIYGGSFQTGRIENSYYKLTAPNGRKFLILTIEFEKRQAVLDWANPIIAANPDYEVIIVTHEIMDELTRTSTGKVMRSIPSTDGTPQVYGFTDCHCGQQLWDELTSLHKNIIMTFNGHYLDRDGDGIATGHRTDEGVCGNRVFQSLFDAQWISNGGDGWMRLVEFLPDGTVQEKSYSPYLDEWRTGNEYQFANAPRVGDINRNSEVDFQDYVIFAQNWLLTECGWCDGADLDGNGTVDTDDFKLLCEKWLVDYTDID
ncbi:MAG TPA: metallophosphoesterase, partial [Sedimentisphaerales bacterium]|nr:metallophosphoesterase [Sedimentisphaerales bacterium]